MVFCYATNGTQSQRSTTLNWCTILLLLLRGWINTSVFFRLRMFAFRITSFFISDWKFSRKSISRSAKQVREKKFTGTRSLFTGLFFQYFLLVFLPLAGGRFFLIHFVCSACSCNFRKSFVSLPFWLWLFCALPRAFFFFSLSTEFCLAVDHFVLLRLRFVCRRSQFTKFKQFTVFRNLNKVHSSVHLLSHKYRFVSRYIAILYLFHCASRSVLVVHLSNGGKQLLVNFQTHSCRFFFLPFSLFYKRKFLPIVRSLVVLCCWQNDDDFDDDNNEWPVGEKRRCEETERETCTE